MIKSGRVISPVEIIMESTHNVTQIKKKIYIAISNVRITRNGTLTKDSIHSFSSFIVSFLFFLRFIVLPVPWKLTLRNVTPQCDIFFKLKKSNFKFIITYIPTDYHIPYNGHRRNGSIKEHMNHKINLQYPCNYPSPHYHL